MMFQTMREGTYLIRLAKNPHQLVLDRLGWRTRPYTILLRNGLRMELRPKRGDRYTFYEAVIRGDYTAHGQLVPSGGTVIDVGANIGCFTLLAARAVGPTGRVFAVEPNSATFRQLQHNISINGLRNVTAVRAAIGGSVGRVSLHSSSISLFCSTYKSVNDVTISGEVEQVQMTTLLQFMEENGIAHCDYLKLDCEGSEYDILNDLPAGMVSEISVEFHRVNGARPFYTAQRLSESGFYRVYTGPISCFRYNNERTMDKQEGALRAGVSK
jgi:FkbM family methyltransferase